MATRLKKIKAKPSNKQPKPKRYSWNEVSSFLDKLVMRHWYRTSDEYRSIRPSYSGISKWWRTTSKWCSSADVLLIQLAIPDDEISKIDKVLNKQWHRYLQMYYRSNYIPHGTQAGNIEEAVRGCELVDPNSVQEPRTLRITNAIAFKGKIYALSLQGTLVAIDLYNVPVVTVLSTKSVIPSTPSRGFREYLMEIEGQIHVVFLISRKSLKKIDDIEVLHLDLPTCSWIKRARVDTLFVSPSYCIPLSSWLIGCRSNCIYFTQYTSDDWWVFNMEDGSIVECSKEGSLDKLPLTQRPQPPSFNIYRSV